MKKNNTFVDSLNAATDGFIHVVKTQRNMRVHFLMGVSVILLSIYLDLAKSDILYLCAAISLVFITEMINTAIELISDLVKNEIHPVVRNIKDISAGAVFIASLNALVTGYMVFSKILTFNIEGAVQKLRESPWHLTFISLLVLLFLVVFFKVISKKGTPFRGGMPSGHAAFAFAIFTIIAYYSQGGLVTVLAFIMAAVIARHRVTIGIHTGWEVVVGGLLGILSTALIFKIIG